MVYSDGELKLTYLEKVVLVLEDRRFLQHSGVDYKELKLKRKLYEAFLAYLVRFRHSKILILRSYLRCAYFGSHLIGAEKASLRLFGKQISDLDEGECAQIAAMLVYPKPLVPQEHWRAKVARRAKYGQRRLLRFEKGFGKLPS